MIAAKEGDGRETLTARFLYTTYSHSMSGYILPRLPWYDFIFAAIVHYLCCGTHVPGVAESPRWRRTW